MRDRTLWARIRGEKWRVRHELRAMSVVALVLAGLARASGPPDLKQTMWEAQWADHLPPYCLYTQLLPDHTYGKWQDPISTGVYAKRFGPTWLHLHHYCFGLQNTFEASTTDDEMLRRSLFSSAITEFNYVIDRAPDDFVLKPEILVNRGAAEEVLGLASAAVVSYTEALRLDPAHVPAYIGLSTCFETLGDTAEALTVVDAGLRRVPDSDELRDRRKELESGSARR